MSFFELVRRGAWIASTSLPASCSTFPRRHKRGEALRTCGRNRDEMVASLLIAAQALEALAVVVTSNEKHFQGIVEALPWEKVLLREGE